MNNEIESNKLRYDNTTNYIMHRITEGNEFRLITMTVTFKSRGQCEAEDKWMSYYKKNVLNKLRRRLASGKAKRQQIITIDDLAQYELDISSKFTAKKTHVHHIHALIPIPSDLYTRIINETGDVNERLKKDILSMHDVSSVLIEALDKQSAYTWLNYMTKGKHKSNFSWNK